jgi:LuxR family maltose regulon positive regulatory protein
MLGLFRAGLLLSTGAIDAGIRQIDRVERELQQHPLVPRSLGQARVVALRCLVACFMNDLQVAETYAGPALAELSPEDHMLRSAIHHALGDNYRRHGMWQQARSHYLQALELTREPAYHIRSVHVLGSLADLALEQGQLHHSALFWKRALALIETRATWGALPLPVTGWVFIRYAELLYAWNRLDDARRHLEQGIERVELGGDVRGIIAGYLLRARLHLATGELGRAADDLERCRPLVAETAFPETTADFERRRIEIWMAQGQYAAAVARALAAIDQPAPAGVPEKPIATLAHMRVLTERGDQAARERALARLDHLLHAADASGQASVAIEALALIALAHIRNGDQAAALIALERALRLAEPDGYIRLFADLGLPMARLLQAGRSRGVMPEYIDRLLAAFGDLPGTGRKPLPEPLSERETEVLRLLAAGLTNQEIANSLVFTAETVKKHTSSIYGKLGVRSRTEAAARGRALDLLDDPNGPP